MPFDNSTTNTLCTYIVLLVMCVLYLKYFHIDPKVRPVAKDVQYYALVGSTLATGALVAYITFAVGIILQPITLLILLFVSFVHTFFFMGVVQNHLEKFYGMMGVVATIVFAIIIQINPGSLTGAGQVPRLLGLLLTTTLPSLVYHRTRNILVVGLLVFSLGIVTIVLMSSNLETTLVQLQAGLGL
jgi:hypothetical protein